MALLSAEEVTVDFGGLRALSEVSLEVAEGQVTGLIGPNGAGKSTCFNVITGLQPPTSGRIRFEGADISGRTPFRRARMGVARTFQKVEVFGSLTARDNVLVAAEQQRARGESGADRRKVANELLERVGIGNVSHRLVSTLPTGTARLVELARALATRPKVLLLDEPSSGLTEEETKSLAQLLRSLADDGLSVLLVEHDMAFVMGTCEHIYVLDFGTIIADGTPREVQSDPNVQAAYLGADVEVAS